MKAQEFQIVVSRFEEPGEIIGYADLDRPAVVGMGIGGVCRIAGAAAGMAGHWGETLVEVWALLPDGRNVRMYSARAWVEMGVALSGVSGSPKWVVADGANTPGGWRKAGSGWCADQFFIAWRDAMPYPVGLPVGAGDGDIEDDGSF